jgi:hypothetical protein
MEIPEQYIYIKPQDIAAICLDIALTKENIDFTFANRRLVRDKISTLPLFKERFEQISNQLNELSDDITDIIELLILEKHT